MPVKRLVILLVFTEMAHLLDFNMHFLNDMCFRRVQTETVLALKLSVFQYNPHATAAVNAVVASCLLHKFVRLPWTARC